MAKKTKKKAVKKAPKKKTVKKKVSKAKKKVVKKKESLHMFTHAGEHQRFFCKNGEIFVNLHDLATALESMHEEDFNHHVNHEKNDFVSWIYDILGDVNLAKNLRGVLDKNTTSKKVKARVASIKRQAKAS